MLSLVCIQPETPAPRRGEGVARQGKGGAAPTVPFPPAFAASMGYFLFGWAHCSVPRSSRSILSSLISVLLSCSSAHCVLTSPHRAGKLSLSVTHTSTGRREARRKGRVTGPARGFLRSRRSRRLGYGGYSPIDEKSCEAAADFYPSTSGRDSSCYCC